MNQSDSFLAAEAQWNRLEAGAQDGGGSKKFVILGGAALVVLLAAGGWYFLANKSQSGGSQSPATVVPVKANSLIGTEQSSPPKPVEDPDPARLTTILSAASKGDFAIVELLALISTRSAMGWEVDKNGPNIKYIINGTIIINGKTIPAGVIGAEYIFRNSSGELKTEFIALAAGYDKDEKEWKEIQFTPRSARDNGNNTQAWIDKWKKNVSFKGPNQKDDQGTSLLTSKLNGQQNNSASNEPSDLDEAIQLYQKSANQGDPEAQLKLGQEYAKWCRLADNNINIAAGWYHKSAKQGNIEAQYELGKLYAIGYGVNKDVSRALELYKNPAEKGNLEALFNIAYIYENGDNTIRNPVKAAEYYLKAANLGHKMAQRNIGVLLYNGVGIPRDYTAAYMWIYLNLKEDPSDISRKTISKLEGLMSREQILEAQARASKWRVQ